MESTSASLLLKIAELSKAHVKISNPDQVCDKLRKMKDDGKEKLQVITDFDHTITKYKVEGTNYTGLGGLMFFEDLDIYKVFINDVNVLMSEVIRLMTDLSINYDNEGRINRIDEIWKALSNIIKKIPVGDSSHFGEFLVKKNKKFLRVGGKALFDLLNINQVPITIISGGFGDTASAILKYENINLNNGVHIIANFFKYKNGQIDGLTIDEAVHPFNKHLHFIRSEFYVKELTKRSNIILVGDIEADSHMTDAVPETSTILKIGFINNESRKDALMEGFMKQFDIVIMDAESFLTINAILEFLLA